MSEETRRKLVVFLLFIPLAIVAAGVFGMLHDQLSITVSPEYFLRYKFLQFHLPGGAAAPRLGAAIVGFKASWWMGIPLGVLAAAAGFIHPTARAMRHALLWSMPVIMAITAAASLTGLFYGWFHTATINPADYQGWFVPPGLVQLRNYLTVGYMHNATYLGGLLAIPGAWLFHFLWRRRHAATGLPPV